jgi:leader peptidase (prepilin peptidase)/N-methyltransferase
MIALSAASPPSARRLGPRALLSALLAVPLVAASFALFGLSAKAFLAAFFVSVLAVLSVVDLQERRLPNRIVLPAFAIVLAAHVALSPGQSAEWTIAALGAAAFFFVPALFYPAAMGMGDVKLALLLGAMLGKAVATAILVGAVGAGVVGVALLLVYGGSARKRAIAFGPYLALGGVVALFAGDLVAL